MEHSKKFLAIVDDAKSRIREMTVEDVQKAQSKGDSLALVDVREDREWSAGHASGAVHLGKGIIERDIEQRFPDASTKIVLYCGGGYRSALAADALQKMGYEDVYSLAGGWRAWTQANMPIAQGE